ATGDGILELGEDGGVVVVPGAGGVAAAPQEAAEAARADADVADVDVAADDVGDLVADQGAAQLVGGGLEVGIHLRVHGQPLAQVEADAAGRGAHRIDRRPRP